MPSLHNRVDNVLEKLKALLITAGETNTEMRPENTSLHAVGKRDALGGLDTLELGKQLRGHVLVHQRLVLVSEGRQLREGDVLELIGVLAIRRRGRQLCAQPPVECRIDLGQLEFAFVYLFLLI